MEKLCADEERPGFEYNEGCDTITVPFKQRECYCKQNLCNSANKHMLAKKEVFIVGSIPELGEWQLSRAVKLTWSEGHIWVLRKQIN